jgi:hypothetical protein
VPGLFHTQNVGASVPLVRERNGLFLALSTVTDHASVSDNTDDLCLRTIFDLRLKPAPAVRQDGVQFGEHNEILFPGDKTNRPFNRTTSNSKSGGPFGGSVHSQRLFLHHLNHAALD